MTRGQDVMEEPSVSPFCWWRSCAEFAAADPRLRPDLSGLANLTPRLKVLREMERLALVAPDGLDEMRHKLVAYRAGDFWLPAGGVRKEDMVIPPIITVLLVGLSGAGKSSLVNLMYSVLGRSGLIPFAQTSNYPSSHTTMYMEEHNVLRSMRSGFCVYDTRGLDVNDMRVGLEEVSGWMTCGVRHYQPCLRPGDVDAAAREGSVPLLSSARFNTRQVNCAMVVANMAELYNAVKTSDLKPLEATKELFHCPAIRKSNDNPLLVLTHGDKLKPDDRILSRIKICEYLGISETTGTYDIACLTENGISPEESDPVTAFAVTEAIYRTLIQSDRTHLPKRRPLDWMLLCLSWVMCVISSFFALLAYVFSKMAKKHNLKM